MAAGTSLVQGSYADFSAKLVLLQKLPQQLLRIDPQCPREVDEFDDIDPPFANLDSGDHRLGGLESRGQLML